MVRAYDNANKAFWPLHALTDAGQEFVGCTVLLILKT
jgi:hypothetical protein